MSQSRYCTCDMPAVVLSVVSCLQPVACSEMDKADASCKAQDEERKVPCQGGGKQAACEHR